MKVLVKQEFWAHGVQRHRAGEVMEMDDELYRLYSIFVKKVDAPKKVEKVVEKPVRRYKDEDGS